jgi:dTDP-4-amino-4,6-dideoxygalactose transaminase
VSELDGIINFVDLSYQNDPLKNSIITKISKLIDSGNFLLGENLSKFEIEYSSYLGAKGVVGVANGTDALEISIRALELSENSTICVPSLTFAATGLAVIRSGHICKFVDIDIETGQISLDSLKKLKTKPDLIIAVSLFGRKLDDNLINWINENGIKLIEDGAQSQGAKFNGVRSTTVSPLATTSFYPTKNLGCFGDGGAVIINDESFIKKVEELRNYGSRQKYVHDSFGFNSRLSEIQSLVLLEKLRHLDKWNSERIVIAERYFEMLKDISKIKLPNLKFDGTNVFHLFPILVKNRDFVKEELGKAGVQLGIHYPRPLHLEGAFNYINREEASFINSERWAKENLTLPIYPGLTMEMQQKVVSEIQKTI